MKNRRKRLAVLLGVTVLTACQTGNFMVCAEEPVPLEAAAENFPQAENTTETDTMASDEPAKENAADVEMPTPDEHTVKENAGENEAVPTDDSVLDNSVEDEKPTTDEPAASTDVQKDETATTETEAKAAEPQAEASDAGTRESQVFAAENLRWENGKAVFYNSNEGKVTFEVHIYKDGAYPDGKVTTRSVTTEVKGDVSVTLPINGDGVYTYKVVTYADGVTPDHSTTSGKGIVSADSDRYDTTAGNDATTDSQQLKPAEGLTWDSKTKGFAYFLNPNKSGVVYKVQLYRDGEAIRQPETYFCEKYEKYIDLFYFEGYIVESGSYVFEVASINTETGEVIGTSSSNPYEYTKPEKQLPAPTNGAWSEAGVFSCDWEPANTDDTVSFRVTHQGNMLTPFGSNYVESLGIKITKDNGYIEFNLNEYLSKCYNLTPANGDSIEVQAVSQNIEEYTNSAWSEKIAFQGGSSSTESNSSSDSSSSSSENSGSSESVKQWEPVTPDEIKRYAVYSREKVVYTADAANAYAVVINNAMQGSLCFDSFEAVLGDYTIGRTYNIIPSGKTVYRMDSKARITLNIPKSLQAEGRDYKMICVTENGQPVMLDDLDSNPSTITFETDTYYAFALVYRNVAVTE